MDLVETLAAKIVDHRARDRPDVCRCRRIGHVGKFSAYDRIVTQEPIAALLAHGDDLDLTSLIALLLEESGIAAQHIGVESPGQPAIGCDQDRAHAFDLGPRVDERIRGPAAAVKAGNVAEDLARFLRIGTCRQHLLLRASHLRRGHSLHRPCDLGDVRHRADAAANFTCTCHACFQFSVSYLSANDGRRALLRPQNTGN